MSVQRSSSVPLPDETPLPRSEPCNLLIRKLQGLVNLTATDFAMLERFTSQPRTIGAHVDLIAEGEVPRDAVLVLEGFACLYRQRLTGQRQIIAYLLPGDLCAVDALDLGQLNYAVGTLSTCQVARVPRQALAEAITHHPNIAQALRLAKLVEEATLRAWIVNLGCRSAFERMAHLFCELMVRFEAVGLTRDSAYPLPLTQSDLAQTLGFSNVHANRVLQELRRQGLVELRGKSLRVRDLARLRDIAEFSAAYLQPASRSTGLELL